MHFDAEKILEWFSKNHPNFDLLSNCLKPDKLIEAVNKYPPKRLFISLDGNKSTYKYMRGKDGYDNVIKVIQQCKDLVPVSVMFTLSPYNDFSDLDHVIRVCQEYGIDIRIGIYNDIDFFDTIEKAHKTEISSLKNECAETSKKERTEELSYQKIFLPQNNNIKLSGLSNFQKLIPQSVKNTTENLDFLLLYDEWRKKQTKLKCYSILDSIVIHPNGDVPVCQNLSIKLGNVFDKKLDEIFNSAASQIIQKKHVHNCNECWINFHRKYDIVMLRALEKFFPKRIIELIYGKYQWCFDPKLTYREYMNKFKK